MKTTHRHESGDLLSVLNQLNTDTLANGRVGLFGLYTDFFEDDTLSMRRSSSRGSLVDVAKGTLFVGFVGLSNRVMSTLCLYRCVFQTISPIGFPCGQSEACGRLEDHEVCWLEKRHELALQHGNSVEYDVQPILVVVVDGDAGDRLLGKQPENLI